MTWTDEEIAVVRKLWPDKKMSASMIGAQIGKTRNAVIGKAHRLGLPPRDDKVVRHRVTRVRAPQPVSAAVTPAEDIPAPDPLLAPETHPEPGQCRYMTGDPQVAGWQFCGNPTYSSRKPFCEYHAKKLLVPNIMGKVTK